MKAQSGIPLGAKAPSEPQAVFRQAVALHQQGQLLAANALYQQVLARQPGHFDALHLSGVIAAQTGDPLRAAALIGKALDIDPSHAAAHSNLGNVLETLRRFEDAVASHDRAIALQPAFAGAHSNRGNALLELGRAEEAIASYDRAIALEPRLAEAHCNRGKALVESGHPHEALASLDHAVSLAPDRADAHFNRSIALHALGRLDDALAALDKVIELDPAHSQAHANRGNTLQVMGRTNEALASFDRAIALRPDDAQAHYNRGVALQESRRLDEAIECYDRATAIQPAYAEAHWNRALALLASGDFRQGWAAYEWRWRRDKPSSPIRDFTQPLWLGEEDLSGKTILLHAEQGMGDAIQFCRYAGLVRDRGARVLLEVPAALRVLLEGLAGVDALVEKGQPLPPFDFHCPLLSLPLAFRTELADIPGPARYLAADARRIARWSNTLGPRRPPRVGLVWSGSSVHPGDQRRTIPLRLLRAALPEHCDIVSLQQEVRATDQEALKASGIRHYGAELVDFAETAALCESMDVVVSVDTSVAHLAGAIGREVWVLLPHDSDWRWLADRDDSPWYPTMRLFRQGPDRQWAPVLDKVRAALDAGRWA